MVNKLRGAFYKSWGKSADYTRWTNGKIESLWERSRSQSSGLAYQAAVWSALILCLWGEVFVVRICGMNPFRNSSMEFLKEEFTVEHADGGASEVSHRPTNQKFVS